MKEFYTKVIRTALSLFLPLFCFCSGVLAQTTYTVTTTADAGPGSLRQAILDANANGGGDFIEFNFSTGTAPFIITTATPLPQITGSLFINGYSEPASVQGPIGARTITVQIDGNDLVSPILEVQADNVTIAGLSLVNSGGPGIFMENYLTALRVWGCYIGAGIDGNSTGAPVAIAEAGIQLGYSPGGTYDLYNRTQIGVQDLDFYNGLAREYEGNVIGNCAAGITSIGQIQMRVRGNYVGIGANGSSAIPNTGAGILLNTVSTDCVVGYSDQDTLSAVYCPNYVGNSDEGITVRDGAKYNVVAGNFVGVTPVPGVEAPVSNAVIIENAHNNRIGTNANGVNDAAEGNVIKNNSFGLVLYNSVNASTSPDSIFAASNKIMGNQIDSNFVGIVINNFSTTAPVTSNIIGSDGIGANAAVEGNSIKFNTNGGLQFSSEAVGPILLNRISANSFEGNSSNQLAPGLSIAFNSDGIVPPIDCGDADAGPNGLLNRPIIDSVKVIGTNVVISGWSGAGQTLEFYIAGGNSDFGFLTQPFGELKTYLFSGTEGAAGDAATGTSLSEDDGTGATCTLNNFMFTVPLATLTAAGFVVGDNINAIALDAATGPANTSDFGRNVVSLLPVTYLSFTGQAANNVVNLKWETASENNSSHFDVQRSADGVSFVTIGTVAAAGNSEIKQTYVFTDRSPLKGSVSYYRLKQVDLDARFEISKTILVKLTGSNNRFAVSPNPVSSYVVVNLVSDVKETVTLKLIDNNGRVVKTFNQALNNGANQIRLNDLGTLPTGVYVLQIKGKSLLINEKIMKY